jgi:hypothetical protein
MGRLRDASSGRERLLGRYTQEQCYLVLRWAFPVLVLTLAGAMILSAVA